jgi:hypothetical protein
MHTLTKRLKNEIKEIAEKLPVSYYEANAGIATTGKDLLKEGVKAFLGKPIEPDKVYTATEGWMFPVNHRRQLERAYTLMGKDGIVEYLKGQNELHHPKPLISFPSVQI